MSPLVESAFQRWGVCVASATAGVGRHQRRNTKRLQPPSSTNRLVAARTVPRASAMGLPCLLDRHRGAPVARAARNALRAREPRSQRGPGPLND